MISDLCKSYSDDKEFTILEKYLGKPPYKLKTDNPEEYERQLAIFKVKEDLFKTKNVALNTLRNMSRGYSLQTDGADIADPNEVLMENDVAKMLGGYPEATTYSEKLQAHGTMIVESMRRHLDANAIRLKDAEDRATKLGIATK
jgi:hypothetical protein